MDIKRQHDIGFLAKGIGKLNRGQEPAF